MSPDNTIFERLTPAQLLAVVIYGEARGEPVEGQVAVGCVIRNRVTRRKKTYREIILQPWQFSCLNEGDPNRDRLARLAEGRGDAPGGDDQMWAQCLWVAQGVQQNYVTDTTGGADHYLTQLLFEREDQRPSWAKADAVTKRIGNHVFLNLE